MLNGYITVNEASARLGVSKRQIRHLVNLGEIASPSPGLISETDIDQRLLLHAWKRQAWGRQTAWAAIALLAGVEIAVLDPARTSRLRSRIRSLDPSTLVGLTRNRADRCRFRVHSSSLATLASEIITDHPEQLGMAGDLSAVEGYVTAAQLSDLTARFFLTADRDGAALLRRVDNELLSVVQRVADNSHVLTALDLAESLESRKQETGRAELHRLMDEFRRA